MSNLQSVSIIAAFPTGMVIVLIAVSFLVDADRYLRQRGAPYEAGEEENAASNRSGQA